MGNRRSFLRNNALLLAGLAVKPSAKAENRLLAAPGNQPGEDYWKQVRAQFPLAEDRIFLNNGTMGPCSYPVLHAVKESLDQTARNMGYGGGEKEAIEAISGLVGANVDEIALVHNVTEAINIAAWGMPLKKGDEVLMTGHEHVGNALPWLNRARHDGIQIRIVELGATAAETLNHVDRAINKKTRAIALPHIPCTIGQVLPAKEICTLGRSKGLLTFIDGAHPPGMLQVNLHDIGCDFYASCCHKWIMAPQGTAFLYVRKEMQDTLRALFVGGGSDTGWDMLSEQPHFRGYAPSAHRYFYGTQSAALYKGIEAAIAFQHLMGTANIENRVKQLSGYLQEKLLGLGDGIRMLTPVEARSRGGQVAFTFNQKDTDKFQEFLKPRKIVVRYVPENNINCIRVSTHVYNSHADIDALMDAVKEYLG
jgi:selenocysteine lyase/cysteine desulfurase